MEKLTPNLIRTLEILGSIILGIIGLIELIINTRYNLKTKQEFQRRKKEQLEKKEKPKPEEILMLESKIRRTTIIMYASIILLVVVLLFNVYRYWPHGMFVGSKESDVYHYPNCRYVKKILPENIIWFSSIEDARNHGYRPCKVCKPP